MECTQQVQFALIKALLVSTLSPQDRPLGGIHSLTTTASLTVKIAPLNMRCQNWVIPKGVQFGDPKRDNQAVVATWVVA